MRKLLLAVFLASVAIPAEAGTITITIVTAGAPCNAGACTKTYTAPDADLAKIITAYGPQCQNIGQPPCTQLQTIQWWVDSLIQNTVSTVTSFYQRQVSTAVVPINPQ
jgi:hypothetical protein